jgi:2-aminobenzoate-CoA ligase
MGARNYDPYLPTRDLWPELLFTRPEFQYPATLNAATELLDVHVSRGHGDDPAVLFEDQRISYAELQRQTNRIGHALKRLGVAPGDRVAMRIPNRPVFVAAWLAVQKIGAIGVATMPMLRARELVYIANDCGAAVFLCAPDLVDELVRARESFDHSVVIVGTPSATGADHSLDELMAGGPDDLDAHPTNRDDLAIIAYTSGSTGVPKGTVHTATDILAAADGYARSVLQPTGGDVFGGHPTLAFTFGLGGLLVFPMRAGASTLLMDRFTPEDLLAAIGRHRVTLLFCAATTYRILLQIPGLERAYDLRSLRYCVSAGETLPATVYDEWYRRTGVEILDGLGSTEMFHVFISARAGAVRPGATGTPVPGYQAKIVDDRFNEAPRGTPGLLAVKGPTGCRYWRKPDRQREYVQHGWNVTGDVYLQDADGYFWYQCRNDDLIICGGYNIAGPEVERVLLEHPAVLEAAVVASPDRVRGVVPKAFVVLKPGAQASDRLVVELQEYVKRELAPYKYPREIEFVTALPRTETGKIRRVELRERERQRKAQPEREASAERTPLV